MDNGTPFTINIQGAQRTGVMDIAGADVSFFANPVALVKGLALVVRVVKVFFR